MGQVRSKVTVTAPAQGAATVNIYRSDGSTLANAFTTETGSTAHSFPVTVALSTSTDFWLQNGDYVVSATLNSVESAGGYGLTRALRVEADGWILRPEFPAGGGTVTLGTTAGTGLAVNTVNAKGDLIAATADNTVTRLAVGTDGFGLAADSTAATGLAWSTVFSRPQVFNAQTGTTYTLVAGDIGKIVSLSNASAITLTVPQDSDATIAIGSYIDCYALGAGQITVVAGTGATLRTSGLTAKSRAQYARFGLQKVSANTWSLFGDLAAS